jgi:hypothetical protein
MAVSYGTGWPRAIFICARLILFVRWAKAAERGRVHRFRILVWIALAGLLASPASLRAEPDATNAPVRSLGPGLYAVGLVRLNSRTRTLTFPATVNLREETVEYALVHKTGKTHESIFRTDARPMDLQVALLLLGLKARMTNSFGADGKSPPVGDKVWVEVGWTNQDERVSCPIEDLVWDRTNRIPLRRGEWIYHGSNFSEGLFTAQRDGSILSIHIDPDALINNPRPGRENDDRYVPNTAKLPPIGTPVEITLRLAPPK